jgi:hypothetical protein
LFDVRYVSGHGSPPGSSSGKGTGQPAGTSQQSDNSTIIPVFPGAMRRA